MLLVLGRTLLQSWVWSHWCVGVGTLIEILRFVLEQNIFYTDKIKITEKKKKKPWRP